MRLALAVLLIALLPAAVSAREPGMPAPPAPLSSIDSLGANGRRHFYMKPETEEAAAKAEIRMKALERRSAKRVQRATGSICEDCSNAKGTARSRWTHAQPTGDQDHGDGVAIKDPAQARMD
jgi:hypothetical protein